VTADSEEAPGRQYFLEFVAKNATLSRTRFLDAHTKPVLLITSEAFAAAANIKATSGDVARTGPPSGDLPFYLYVIEKRAGANTTPAITVGRAPTNDIIITDPGVSRIHTAFFPQKEGRFSIADASTLGTWVDGSKLQAKKHCWLGVSNQIQFGPAVYATFMAPEKLFELVAKALPQV
jgi:hypothetical protein